jgi:ATP diphosphatase
MNDGKSDHSERALSALLRLMERLRDPERGCPWDREQTFATIAPYTIEEAYEVADAAERGDPDHLRDELGDLLFQVVFHARMAQERGWFDFADVARAIHDKLVRRHPHVFVPGELATEDPKSASELSRSWEELKARERAEKGEASALAGVPKALPALTRAAKLGRRAARVGFDWPDAGQVRAKVLEELAEVDAALEAAPETNSEAVVEEMGDLLFAVVNWTRHLKLEPEEALRAANAKFEQRFRRMESLAAARERALEALSPAEWDALWREVKLHD